MSINSPIAVLFDINSNPIGVNTNPLSVQASGSVSLLGGTVQSGSTARGFPVQIGVVDSNGILRGLLSDASGRLQVASTSIYTLSPQAISGSVSIYTHGAQLISGSVNVLDRVSVFTQGPQAVTGSVSVYTQGAQLISGTVGITTPGISVYTQGAQQISGSVSVLGGVSVYTQGTQAVSGTVGITTPGISVYTQGAQLISGTIAITSGVPVYTQGPQLISGSVSVYTQGIQAVSGTVGITTHGISVYTQGPQAISGTVSVTTSGIPVYTQGAQLISGTISIVSGTNTVPVKPGNTAPVASDPALTVALSPNFGTQGNFPITFGDPGTLDSFGHLVTGFRVPQLQAAFFQSAPSNILNITTAAGATSSQNLGTGVFTLGGTAGSTLSAVTYGSISYSAHYEIYTAGTLAFTGYTGVQTMRWGIYNATDGFSIGYNGASGFGLWSRYNSVDTFVAKTSWNVDTLVGSAGSKFTSGNVPIALDPSKINLYRIRFGWFGVASVFYEVLSPDDNWVIIHIVRYTNSGTVVSATSPNLPITLEMSKTSGGTTPSVICGCWVGGVVSGAQQYINGTGTITSTVTPVIFATTGVIAAAATITGTFNATLAFQYSIDDGKTWVTDSVIDASTNATVTSLVNNGAYTGTFKLSISGYRQYRIVATSFTSGTANVSYTGGAGAPARADQGVANTVTNAWPFKLTDGVSTSAVKAASTAAVAADPALVVSVSPNSPINGTFRPSYGASGQAMTITLAGLASTSARASTAVVNTTSLFKDVHLFFKFTSANAGTSASGTVLIYGYGTVDGGTTYPEGITGTDAAITLSSPVNLVLLATVNLNTNASTKTYGPISFCSKYGLDYLPANWGVVVVNSSGANFPAGAGNFSVTYQGLNPRIS